MYESNSNAADPLAAHKPGYEATGALVNMAMAPEADSDGSI